MISACSPRKASKPNTVRRMWRGWRDMGKSIWSDSVSANDIRRPGRNVVGQPAVVPSDSFTGCILEICLMPSGKLSYNAPAACSRLDVRHCVSEYCLRAGEGHRRRLPFCEGCFAKNKIFEEFL